MSRLCKAAPLFRHLVSAVIIFADQYYDENMSDSHHSPNMKQLTILPRGSNGSFVVSWPVVEILMQMSLRSLDLGELCLDSGEYEESEDDDESKGETSENTRTRNNAPPVEWRGFLSSVPNLEELRIERQEI
ncbi:hypothetical protein RhiLY_06548 [Ceratobasidium sp. AG-Ba]|nr:hypothetical protein RhiLY_06548 [Ceratobasidium sp. AG-Ba]